MSAFAHAVRRGVLRAHSIVVTLVVVSSGLPGQTSVIEVTDHRPLAVALDRLQAATGVAINYEDIPYENIADLEDVSTPEQRVRHPAYRLRVPCKGQVKATVGPRARESISETLAIVYALLSSYRAAGLPGDFKVDQANGMVYVAPSKVLKRTGSLQDAQSLMETVVSVPYAERRVIDCLETITRAISTAAGTRIAVGTFPFTSAERRVAWGASGIAARDALAALLHKVSDAPASYNLLFDPMTGYMLNLRFIARPEPPSVVPEPAHQITPSPFFVPPKL
jgi:hypothetical protein